MNFPAQPFILPETLRSPRYDADCRRCRRLAQYRDEIKRQYPTYWCRPVPPFGDDAAELVIVGLAPGLHGANASGRVFTGDYAGILLFETLHAFGFGSQPTGAERDDGLTLLHCRINNSVKCVPPGNKPLPEEVRNCNGYLVADLVSLPPGGALLALGRVAHDAALRALSIPPSQARFAHGARHVIDRPAPGVALFDSYHCSRYNTNTGRLTPRMFGEVFAAIARHLGRPLPP